MLVKKAETQVPVADLIAARWSGRAYDKTRTLAVDQITALLEAARWAPSCFGDQPWAFIVCDRSRNEAAWQRCYECLAEGNQGWAGNAPLLLIALASGRYRNRDGDNRWGQYDTGAASMSLCLQATALGLMAHQMGGFDKDKVREVFAVPEQYTPMATIAVGYQLPLEQIATEQKERETAARGRLPLTENFFAGHWGTSYTQD